MAMRPWVQGYPSFRRTQFSSCDACRQLRVACDASKYGHQPEAGWGGSCTRCATQHRRCTFEWIKKRPRKPRRHSTTQTAPVSNTSRLYGSSDLPNHASVLSPYSDSFERSHSYDDSHAPYARLPLHSTFPLEPDPLSNRSLSADAELADILLVRYADTLFSHGFGVIFGRWVGRYGCPLVNNPTSDISISPVKLFGELDSYMDEQLPRSPVDQSLIPHQGLEQDDQIERCLRSALHAYTSRWLSLFKHMDPSGHSVQYDKISKSCWRAARKDMLKAINRPCYRSILALYLFGQTPVPLGISQEEELDGLSGVVCSQTALLHVQQLRERLRCCQFNGSKVSDWSDVATCDAITLGPSFTEEYLNLESRAYWATVTWDTSDSMTLNFRSTLSSGLKGACSEPVWKLARSFLVDSFHERTEDWRKKGFRITDDVASQITSATSVCTIYTWRNIASLKEALREGVEEATVLSVWTALLDAIKVFETTIHPILSNCERQLHFLGQVDRLNWYEIVLLYYLGILILSDVLEAANRSDLLQQLAQTGLDAEHECFNVLNFGLENTYTIGPSQTVPTSAPDTEVSQQPLTISFVAIDPYPHHVVAAVRLMDKAFLKQYLQGVIKHEAYLDLCSTLRNAVDLLPQNSKIVQAARSSLQRSLEKFNMMSAK